MNAEWSEKNKRFQGLVSKRISFSDGIQTLIELREELFGQITELVNDLPAGSFFEMPFKNAAGYHSKSLSYSIWHIFRIEDITAHEMIAEDTQILFSGNWQQKIHSPVITTGNEFEGEQIKDFSKQLDLPALYEYAKSVKDSSDKILQSLEYDDLKKTYGTETKEKLIKSKCVSTDEKAFWLIDYWCGKNTGGLLKMPFSRHWIMHIEAMLRISDKLKKNNQKK